MIGTSRRMVVLAVAGAVAIAPVISGCGAGIEPQSAAPTQLTEGVNVSVPRDEPAATQIALRNVFLLGPQPGEPISPGSSLALYGVVINEVKGRQDRLVSVSSPLFGTAKIDGGGLVLPPAAPDGTGSPVKLLGKASETAAPTTTPTAPGGGTEQPAGTATQEPTGATQEPTGTGATSEPTNGQPSGNPAGPQQGGLPAAPGGEQPLVVLTGLKQELFASARVPLRMQFEKAGAVDFQVPIVPRQGEYTSYPLATPAGPAPGSQAPGSAPTPGGSREPSTGVAPTHGGATQQPGSTGAPAGNESPGGTGH